MVTALTLALVMQAAPTTPTDPALDRMVALYEDTCLKAFPDDGAVAATMTARGAAALSRSEVRIYLHDDPGRGWVIADGPGKFVVTIEAPPYHACALRREFAAPVTDMLAYLAAADRYKASGAPFQNMAPMDMPNGDIRTHLEAEGRAAGDQAEALMIVTDTRPDRSVELRFVHQYSPKQ